VERVMLAVGVAPIVLLSSAMAWRLWGWPTALTHLCVSGAFGWLLVEGALWRFTGIPCAEPWQSNGARIRAMWPVYLLLFVASTSGMAGLEWVVLSRPHFAIVITTYLAAIALALRHLAIRRAVGGGIFRPGDSGELGGDSRDASNDGSLFRTYRSRGRVAAALNWIGRLRKIELTPRDSLRRLGHDVRTGLRRLLHRPLYSCFAIGTIAIGAGATTGIYAIAYAVLLKPVGIPQIDRVVNVDQQGLGPFRQRTLSWADYQDLRVMQTSFRQLVAFSGFAEVLSSEDATRIVFGETVDSDYFTLVGARLALGRPLVPSDNLPAAPAVIVLGDNLWRTTFAADPAVVGRSIRLGGELFEVVGVAAADVRGLLWPNIRPTEAWVPIANATRLASVGASRSRNDHWLRVKGRLSDGRTPDQARTELGAIARQLDASHPIHPTDKRYIRRWTSFPAADVRLPEPMSSYSVPLTIIVMTAVGLVLLIACTNLANLNLARAMTRRHEVAVRLAVGASRFRLIQEQVVEAALVALIAGVGAAAIALAATRYFRSDFTLRIAAGFNVDVSPTLTPGVVVVMVGSILLSVLVSGAWPAWRLTRMNARAALSAGSSTVSSSGWRGRQSLVAAQVGGSVVLLAAAVLFAGEMIARVTRNPGFRTDRLAVAQLELSGATRTTADDDILQQRLADRIRQQPGATRVAFASNLPTGMSSGSDIDLGVLIKPPVVAGHIEATPNFLDVMGIRIESGRLFSSGEAADREVVVSRLAAQQLFGHADVIGRQIFVNRRANTVTLANTIVGVASDTDVGSIGRRDRGMVYGPFGSALGKRRLMLVQTADSPEPLIARIRPIVREVDVDVAVIEATTGDVATGVSIALEQFVAGLAGLLGVTALLLAMTGLFGVLSARVADRTREIGIHTALGATRRRVTRMILFDGLRPVFEGLATGAIVALVLRFSAQAMFPRLVPTWNWMLLAVPLLLLFGAAAACYLPTRRATSIEPARTLRDC
jgi:putative ABC transport system permease protein